MLSLKETGTAYETVHCTIPRLAAFVSARAPWYGSARLGSGPLAQSPQVRPLSSGWSDPSVWPSLQPAPLTRFDSLLLAPVPPDHGLRSQPEMLEPAYSLPEEAHNVGAHPALSSHQPAAVFAPSIDEMGRTYCPS